MSKVVISGVIVPSEWTFEREYIQAGIITPLANAVYAIASTEDDLEVVLNSYGGDVFSGNAISNAISRWAEAHPKRSLTVTVDAIALSAAACILAKAPKRAVCRAYRDSLVMFHSASSFVAGGPGAMKDAAELMDKVNDDIRQVLLAKTDIPAETIDTWLSEGRMGWLTGQECRQHGLVSRILNGLPSERPAPLPEEDEKGAHQQIAASFTKINELLTNHLKETPMTNEDEDLKNLPPQNEDEDQEEEKEEKEDQEEEKDDQKEGEASDDASDEGDKEPEKEEEEKKDAENREVEDLRNQVKALEDRCQKAEAALERLTKGLHNSGTPAQSAPKSFQELVAGIPKGITQQEWDERFLQLKKENPSAFRNWMKR